MTLRGFRAFKLYTLSNLIDMLIIKNIIHIDMSISLRKILLNKEVLYRNGVTMDYKKIIAK